jgi:hypothetical protein
MTRLTDYMWSLPHEPEGSDPAEIAALQEMFGEPIMRLLEEPMAGLGYQLDSSDVVVKLDDRIDNTRDTYYANVRFLRYLSPEIIVRVHFEHAEWALFLPAPETHTFFINLDRFKVIPPANHLVPAWPGRLHLRMSNRPEDILEHDGPDQIWQYSSLQELEEQLALFLDKFERLGRLQLEHMSSRY